MQLTQNQEFITVECWDHLLFCKFDWTNSDDRHPAPKKKKKKNEDEEEEEEEDLNESNYDEVSSVIFFSRLTPVWSDHRV